MCSDFCPCNQTTFDTFKKSIETISGSPEKAESFVNKYKRSFNPKPTAPNTPFKTLNKGTMYSNFISCHDAKVDAYPKYFETVYGKTLDEEQQWWLESGVQYFANVEENLDCAGACKTPLFWVF